MTGGWRMLAGMRRLALLIALPALTCTAPAPDLQLDFPLQCERLSVEVRDPAVLPGWTVHALVVLDESGTRGWVYASDANKRRFVRGWPEGPSTDVTVLAQEGRFDLQPGTMPGEAWLLYDRPGGARVWRLGDPGRGEVQEAPDLSEFPGGPGGWTRRLVFVGHVPHLLAAPPDGEASTLQLPLARLDRTTLALDDAWTIEFWSTCSEEDEDDAEADTGGSCVTMPSQFETIREVELLATTQPDGAAETVVLVGLHAQLVSETPDLEPLHDTVMSTLTLKPVVGDGPPDAFRHDRLGWTDLVPLAIAPAQVATDPEGIFVLGGVEIPPDASLPGLQQDQLLEAEFAGDDGSGFNMPLIYLDRDLRSHLLQVDGLVALGQFLEGEWRVAPIVRGMNGTVGVDVDRVADLPVPAGTTARGAGFGHFVLVSPDAPAQRVTLGCAADE